MEEKGNEMKENRRTVYETGLSDIRLFVLTALLALLAAPYVAFLSFLVF